jgi:germination protein M
MSPTRLRRATVAATMVIAATVLAGCGVSTQTTQREIEPSDVPFGLMQSRRPTTTSAPPGTASDIVVYFVGTSGLGAAVREQRGNATAEDALDALAAGPTDGEARAGFRSALVPGSIDDVRVANGLARVDLDPEFLQLGRTEQALAIAQIVFTLTELETVDRVRLLVGGEPLPVAIVTGRTTTAPIDRDQVVVPTS